jgi:predicted RNase H-like HicB family nuclease
MKLVYPVIISRGSKYFLASVPDCEIDTQGENIGQAIEMARDAISLWCVCQQDEGREFPVPSDIASVEHTADEIVTLVDADIDAYRRRLETRTIRKNLTIPAWLAAFAEENNINFSQVLKEALEKIYNQHTMIHPSSKD